MPEIKENELSVSGSYRYGKCPYCQSTDTLVVAGDNSYYCMTCGKSGIIGREPEKRLVPLRKSSRLTDLNAEAAKFFMRNLKDSKGMEYLKDRGLSAKTIFSFGLGYASRTDTLKKLLLKKGFSREELVESGLFKESKEGKLWLVLHDRVIFPIISTGKKVIGFGGRVTDGGEPKYINSPETPVFSKRENLYAWNRAVESGRPEIILCEGYMDVISMHQAGFGNAVASLGTALTEMQAELIRSYTDRVIIMYDTDIPGTNATERAIKVLKKAGFKDIFTCNALPCKDPDEFIRKYGTAELEKRIKDPMPEKEFRIRHAVNEDGNYDYRTVCDILLDDFSETGTQDILERILL